ncbi:Vesicle transport through interaction with t-SNAREs 1B [Chamberlinius hualienensis]
MIMSSEAFENMEDDVRSLIAEIRQKLDGSITRLSGEEKKRAIRDVEREFEECLSMMDEIESEARKAPLPYRNQMNIKVKGFRDDVNKLQHMLRKVSNRSDDKFTRQDLFAGAGSSADFENQQKSRIMQTGDILDRTSQSIARSTQVAVETEQIGHEIISEMGEQRETLLRARDHLEGTDANITQSRKILKSMYLKVMTNKLILAVIIIMELAILVGVVYWKFFT